MGIVGYADHMSVQPGETVKFMVSSQAPRYRADIVRLIHGDANPKGPGIKETVVETTANAEYPGKRQALPLGSYVTVPDNAALRLAGSFTITAWIAPTRHDRRSAGRHRPERRSGHRHEMVRRRTRAATGCSSRTTAGWRSGSARKGGRVEKVRAEHARCGRGCRRFPARATRGRST